MHGQTKAASLEMSLLYSGDVENGQTYTGPTLRLDQIREEFGVQYSWAVTGDCVVDALVFSLQGSIDGTNFVDMDTAETADATELSNKLGLFFVTGKPVAFIRVSLSTVTITSTSGAVTLTIKTSMM